jgi:glycosyltransferase involved in cell wall biosynthesis
MSEIWLFDDAPILGGAELFALRLARFAGKQGLTVRIVCPMACELASRSDDLGIERLPAAFPSLAPIAAPRWPAAILGIRSLLLRAGPGAIAVGNTARAQAYLSAAWLLIRRARRPILVHVLHEQDTLRRRSARLALRHLGSLVAIGENVAVACRVRMPGVAVWKANNFLDPPDREARVPRRSAERPVLGVLGRLIPDKGVLELVEELAQTDTWDRAVIGGPAQDSAYAQRVEERLTGLGLEARVSLVGQIDDVPGFMRSIDALVVPSTGSEGQPTTIIEALAYGCPCLVRRPLWSRDFEGLPVVPYEGTAELEQRLRELPLDAAPAEEIRRRFGPQQALDVIRAAAANRPPA